MESKKPTVLEIVITECNKNFKKEHVYNRYVNRSFIRHQIEAAGYSVLSYDKVRRKLELAGYLKFSENGSAGFYHIIKEIPVNTKMADLERIIMRNRQTKRFGL